MFKSSWTITQWIINVLTVLAFIIPAVIDANLLPKYAPWLGIAATVINLILHQLNNSGATLKPSYKLAIKKAGLSK